MYDAYTVNSAKVDSVKGGKLSIAEIKFISWSNLKWHNINQYSNKDRNFLNNVLKKIIKVTFQ